MTHIPDIGARVHYKPQHGPAENGIVKKLHDTKDSIVFVVYKCGGDWSNYENYTSESTDLCDLEMGWV